MSEQPVIVFDFETTGHSPDLGDRPIEIGAVKIEQGTIVDTFQGLMNPGFPITWFIESLTGISNDLLTSAPPCEEIMEAFSCWIGEIPLVAHNVSFDRKFLDAELKLLGRERTNPMGCTLLSARRLYPEAANHKLATLVQHLGLQTDGTFHRALADAKMTGHLWMAMTDLLKNRYGFSTIPFALMQELCTMGRSKVDTFLHKQAEQQQTTADRQPSLWPSGGSKT